MQNCQHLFLDHDTNIFERFTISTYTGVAKKMRRLYGINFVFVLIFMVSCNCTLIFSVQKQIFYFSHTFWVTLYNYRVSHET